MDEENPCVTCGKPVTAYTQCHRCGRFVHMDTDGACGSWLFDSWHEVAIAGENEFWCWACLHEVYDDEETGEAGSVLKEGENNA